MSLNSSQIAGLVFAVIGVSCLWWGSQHITDPPVLAKPTGIEEIYPMPYRVQFAAIGSGVVLFLLGSTLFIKSSK